MAHSVRCSGPPQPCLIGALVGLPAGGGREGLTLCKESVDLLLPSKLGQNGGISQHAPGRARPEAETETLWSQTRPWAPPTIHVLTPTPTGHILGAGKEQKNVDGHLGISEARFKKRYPRQQTGLQNFPDISITCKKLVTRLFKEQEGPL